MSTKACGGTVAALTHGYTLTYTDRHLTGEFAGPLVRPEYVNTQVQEDQDWEMGDKKDVCANSLKLHNKSEYSNSFGYSLFCLFHDFI